jgi:hypothetical protein
MCALQTGPATEERQEKVTRLPKKKQAFAVGIFGFNGKMITRNYVAIATLPPCDTMA